MYYYIFQRYSYDARVERKLWTWIAPNMTSVQDWKEQRYISSKSCTRVLVSLVFTSTTLYRGCRKENLSERGRCIRQPSTVISLPKHLCNSLVSSGIIQRPVYPISCTHWCIIHPLTFSPADARQEPGRPEPFICQISSTDPLFSFRPCRRQHLYLHDHPYLVPCLLRPS